MHLSCNFSHFLLLNSSQPCDICPTIFLIFWSCSFKKVASCLRTSPVALWQVTVGLYLSVQSGANLPFIPFVPHLYLGTVTATRHTFTLWMRPPYVTASFPAGHVSSAASAFSHLCLWHTLSQLSCCTKPHLVFFYPIHKEEKEEKACLDANQILLAAVCLWASCLLGLFLLYLLFFPLLILT